MEATINYYNENAERYCQETFNAKMTSLQCEFLLRLPYMDKNILDLGCGSGRDSKFFKNYGCEVIAVDGSAEMCKLAEKNIGQSVIYSDLREYKPETPVAGIWANASLLHLTREEIKDNVIRLTKHLLPVGCFYMSFKYGNFSGERDGCFYTDFDETSLTKMLYDIPSLSLVRYTISEDVRPNHSGEKWLNVFCMKESSDDNTYANWKNEAISDDYFLKLCETGNIHEIIKAVNKGANLYAKDNKGRSCCSILRERRKKDASISYDFLSDISHIALSRLDSQSDLILRAVNNEDLEVVKAFLGLGVDVYELCNIRQHGAYYGSAIALAVKNGNFEIVKTMLEYGVNLKDDVISNNDYSALATVIRYGNTDMLKLFLDYHRSSDIETTKYSLAGFALVSAAKLKDTKMAKFLLEYGIDINTSYINSRSETNALITAVAYDNINMVKFLVDNGADIRLQGKYEDDNISAFIIAVHNDAVESIDLLLSIYTPSLSEMGYAVCNSISKRHFRLTEKLLNFLNIYKNSWKEKDYISQILGRALRITAENYGADYREMMKMLLFKYGANVYSTNSRGETALMLAAEHSSPETVEILLKYGADVNAVNDSNLTALIYALLEFSPSKEKIKLLLKAGASTNVLDPVYHYAWDSILSIEEFRNDAEIVKLTLRNCPDNLIKAIFKSLGILEKLADDIDEDYGTTIAMLTYEYDNEADYKEIIWDIARALVEFKKDYGWTALMYASAFCKKEKTISTLLKANSNINERDNEGWTALMCASAFNDNQEIISTLIDAGADLNAINGKGNTALDLAREDENNSAIKLLEAVNADEL